MWETGVGPGGCVPHAVGLQSRLLINKPPMSNPQAVKDTGTQAMTMAPS